VSDFTPKAFILYALTSTIKIFAPEATSQEVINFHLLSFEFEIFIRNLAVLENKNARTIPSIFTTYSLRSLPVAPSIKIGEKAQLGKSF